MLLNFRSSHTS